MAEIPRGVADTLARLMTELAGLPGIGPRSAERIAFYLLRIDRGEALRLADAIRDVKERLRPCKDCYNLTEQERCSICSDSRRDRSMIVVVEQPKDVMLLEQTGLISGLYHVLMGHLSALDRIEPSDLTVDALVKRVRDGGVREVVLATNPNLEGDGTALYIHEALKPFEVQVSRLARGLAVGSQVEYASKAMIEAAITGRTAM